MRNGFDGAMTAMAVKVENGKSFNAPDGTRVGQTRMPEIVSNLCFAESKRNRLTMTGTILLQPIHVEAGSGTIT